jgi:hypothetical protein
MSPQAEVIEPNFARRDFHERKYEIFKMMYEHQLAYRRIMSGANAELASAVNAD